MSTHQLTLIVELKDRQAQDRAYIDTRERKIMKGNRNTGKR